MWKEIKNISEELKTKEGRVATLISLIIGFFIASITFFIYSFLLIQKIKINNIFIFSIELMIFFAVIILFVIAMECYVPKYSDQIRIFAKQLYEPLIVWLDFLLFILLVSYVIFAPFIFRVYSISILSTAMTTVSGLLITPIIKYIINTPIIKVEVLNDEFSYNNDSILELDTNDFVDVRAINEGQNPQVIKFLGFCQMRDMNSIAMKGEKDNKDIIHLPRNNAGDIHTIPMIETVDAHYISRKYVDIAASEIIMPFLNSNTLIKNLANLKIIKTLLSDFSSRILIETLVRQGTLSENSLIKALLDDYDTSTMIDILIKHDILSEVELIKILLSDYPLSEKVKVKNSSVMESVSKTLINDWNPSKIANTLIKYGTLTKSNLIKVLVSSYSSLKIVEILIARGDLTSSDLIKVLLNQCTSFEIINALAKHDALIDTIGTLSDQEKDQDQVYMDAVYKTEDGNYFFRPFNIKYNKGEA